MTSEGEVRKCCEPSRRRAVQPRFFEESSLSMALAQLYETLGGKVAMAGKPHAPIYDLCVIEAERLAGGPVDRSRILCIGDGVATDVKGANTQGLDVLFVAGGIHGAETIGPDGLNAEAVGRLLAQEGAEARWAMAALGW